jgi:hypothetical protein
MFIVLYLSFLYAVRRGIKNTRIRVVRGVYRVLVWKPEGKGTLRRPSCSWRIIFRWIFRNWGVEMLGSGLD